MVVRQKSRNSVQHFLDPQIVVSTDGPNAFQQKSQNSFQQRHFLIVGSLKLSFRQFFPDNWGKGVLRVVS